MALWVCSMEHRRVKCQRRSSCKGFSKGFGDFCFSFLPLFCLFHDVVKVILPIHRSDKYSGTEKVGQFDDDGILVIILFRIYGKVFQALVDNGASLRVVFNRLG